MFFTLLYFVGPAKTDSTVCSFALQGCILVEMHNGQPIFDGKDEAEQLIKMSCVLGAPPQKLVEQSPKRKSFFQVLSLVKYCVP